MAQKIYDAIIIGAGFGGLSAALGLGRQTRQCLVISNQRFRNDGIEATHAVLGHDHIPPQEILARAREQIARYENTTYAEAEIASAQQVVLLSWNGHKGFQVTSRDGQKWQAKTLILATGVKDLLPDLPGYRENWPRNIYQCLFCDGWERKHTQKAVIRLPSLGMAELKLAVMALGHDTTRDADGFAKVTILTNGKFDPNTFSEADREQFDALRARGVKVDARKVVKLEDATPEGQEGMYVHLQNEDSVKTERVLFGYIAHKPPTALNAPEIIKSLGVETTQGMFGDLIKTQGPMNATNIDGVFAAGDCANMMTHVATAVATGVATAAGVTMYLDKTVSEDVLAARGEESANVADKEKLGITVAA